MLKARAGRRSILQQLLKMPQMAWIKSIGRSGSLIIGIQRGVPDPIATNTGTYIICKELRKLREVGGVMVVCMDRVSRLYLEGN